MFALGIPKTQYRRCLDVLQHDLSSPISFEKEQQDDGFFLFSFPEMDEMEFSILVKKLKNNGVTAIGADNQLTEKNIMKLADLIKEGFGKRGFNPKHEGDSPMPFRDNPDANDEWSKERIAQDSAPTTTKVKTTVLDDEKEVTIKYKPGSNLKDVTIIWNEPWGEEEHNVDFEYESDDWRSGDLDGSGSEDITVTAESNISGKGWKWGFSLTAQVEYTFDMTGDFEDWDWNTLEIEKVDDPKGNAMSDDDVERGFSVDAPDRFEEDVEEGTCGYGKKGKLGKTPAGPGLGFTKRELSERFQQLAGIKPLYELEGEGNFDLGLKAAGGFSDEEFDNITSRDPGSRFPGEDEAGMAPRYDSNEGVLQAQDLIEELRGIYRNMSDEELDSFSKEMMEHFLDNTAAQATAKIWFGKRNI